jgi:hypothetical protein
MTYGSGSMNASASTAVWFSIAQKYEFGKSKENLRAHVDMLVFLRSVHRERSRYLKNAHTYQSQL